MDMKDIIKSDKLKSLQNILGLKFSQDEQDNINFNEIVIATDADLPGFFIRGQLLGLFVRFGKNLFKENKIKIFRSPVIVGYDNKENIKEWFYDVEDLQEYEKKNPNTKLTFAWKKGLGSWDQSELEYIIEKEGIDKMLETMVLDDDAEKSIDNWLCGKNANIRKELLDGFEFSINNL
jgi:DNA gyrase/topoisomerase IV subunit B